MHGGAPITKASETTKNESSAWCSCCQAMFGTLDGVRSVFSEKGYQHYTWAQLNTSADSGHCCSCQFLSGVFRRAFRIWESATRFHVRSASYDDKLASYNDKDFQWQLDILTNHDRPYSGFRHLDILTNSTNDPRDDSAEERGGGSVLLYNDGAINPLNNGELVKY